MALARERSATCSWFFTDVIYIRIRVSSIDQHGLCSSDSIRVERVNNLMICNQDCGNIASYKCLLLAMLEYSLEKLQDP